MVPKKKKIGDIESDDDDVFKKVRSLRYGNLAFYKVYKGPKRYFRSKIVKQKQCYKKS